ncbi:hypothetical protein [Corynebacterium aquilae]|nr:hypothetical protein [Corynebacterium aquilae]
MSPTNIAGFSLFAIVMVVLLIQGRWTLFTAMLIGTAISFAMVIHAKKDTSSDVWRIAMFEAVDERDRNIATKALALTMHIDLWAGIIAIWGYVLVNPEKHTWGLAVLAFEIFLLIKIAVFYLATRYYAKRY